MPVQLIFDDLLIKVKEKEEKEAKKRKRLEDEFFDLLCSVKVLQAVSTNIIDPSAHYNLAFMQFLGLLSF